MTFRIKMVFSGLLIGSLLCSTLSFSQVAPVLPLSKQRPVSGSEGGAQLPSTTTPQPQGSAAQGPSAPGVSSSYVVGLPGAQAPGLPGAASSSSAGPTTPGQQPLAGSEPTLAGRSSYAQPAARQEQELSPFEQYVSGVIPATISFDIKQFGYDLFLSGAFGSLSGGAIAPPGATAPPGVTAPPGATAPQGAPSPTISAPRIQALGIPSANVPVGPDYVIGPEDEVRIAVWGGIEGSWSVVVDRDGNISIPKVGTMGVTGLSFQELKELLLKELSKYYNDFQMNVSLGSLRTITVYVVGNARTPGAYSVSSLSTVINALMVAGGPSKAGSMRDIQLKRNGVTVGHLDLYDFLISGDKTKDLRLLPEDVIFIPSIGPIVGVAGNVDRPAIYELKGKTMLSEGLKMAGGVTAAAYLQRVQVERVFQRQTKIIVDVNLEKFKGKHDIPLFDGDIVKIFPIVPQVTNKVVLQGSVRRPGEYEWKPGMRAKDLIPSVDSLLPDTFLNYALVTRLVPPDLHQEYRSFDLEAVLFRHDLTSDILLEPYDIVTVFNKWEMVQKEKVRITGAVNKPGEFEFRPNMKLSDLLKLAGGFRKFAYRLKAELTRVTPMPTGPMTQQLSVNPDEALAGDSEADITLQEDDYLFVRAVPDWQLYRKVSVTGEVKFPGDYALKKGERLSSLLDRAGGFTDKAYLRGATLIRLAVKEAQQKQINEMTGRLENELLAISSADIAGSLSASDAEIQRAEAKQKQAFLASLKQFQASGRVVVNVNEARESRNSALDVEMEDGDVLQVPISPQTVQVVGAVYNQASFIFDPTKDYSYYVDRAGGFSRAADKSQLYVVKVDGSTIRPGWGLSWNTGSRQWESGSPGMIEPGDTIVVPVEIQRIAWLKELKDWTQILYQSAMGAAVVWKIFD